MTSAFRTEQLTIRAWYKTFHAAHTYVPFIQVKAHALLRAEGRSGE
jgi:hypothetical protein